MWSVDLMVKYDQEIYTLCLWIWERCEGMRQAARKQKGTRTSVVPKTINFKSMFPEAFVILPFPS